MALAHVSYRQTSGNIMRLRDHSKLVFSTTSAYYVSVFVVAFIALHKAASQRRSPGPHLYVPSLQRYVPYANPHNLLISSREAMARTIETVPTHSHPRSNGSPDSAIPRTTSSSCMSGTCTTHLTGSTGILAMSPSSSVTVMKSAVQRSF